MVAVLNVTEGKNKVIMSGLAGALSAVIFLTAIHIAAKVAIIIAVATVTYALLSLIHKVAARSAKTHDISEDEGYNSVDESEKQNVITPAEEQKEVEDKSKRGDTDQTQDYMNFMRSSPMHMDGTYQEITTNTWTEVDSNFADSIKVMVVTNKIVLYEPDNRIFAQNNSSSIKSQMKPLPERMNVFGDPLPEQVSSNLYLESKNTQKLSPIDWLLQHGSINNTREEY